MDAFGDSKPTQVPLESGEDQFQAYSRISGSYSHSFLFESLAGPGELAESSVMGFGPAAVFRGYSDRAEITEGGRTRTVGTRDPLGVLAGQLGRSGGAGPRYLGGAVGVASYDAVRLVEDVPDSHPYGGPLLEFGIYDDGIVSSAGGGLSYFYRGRNRLDEISGCDGAVGGFSATDAAPNMGRDEFARIVERARGYIHDGDAFQVVLSRRFSFGAEGDGLALYAALRRLNPSPYMYHVRQGGRTVIGASPEMLIRVSGGRAETFPIAGTRRVTGDAAEDARLASELRASEKEAAEHTMLVDLGRNDIGRVCSHGTIRPESLMQVRRFSHVQHMVTHLSGGLAPGRDMFDAFRAVFPAGTVSGAPKVRAMEIIDELEPVARGPYAGAVGYFGFSGCCDFAIAIRSIFLEGGSGFVQAGAGIVADSVPEDEFAETEHKAEAMLQALREASA